MAPITQFFVLTSAVVTSAYVVPPSQVVRPLTRLSESFGFDFAEDSYENTPQQLLGEANYKQWVQSKVSDNSFLNRKYNVIRRTRELDLLGATVDNGILSKLEKNGLDLATIEKLLPAIEEAGLLGVVANNQQLLVNGLAPVVVEGAPFLLPLVAGALEAGPSAFYLASVAALATEGYLVVSGAELPLVGLPAGAVAGLVLVPLAVATGAVGAFLGGLKK